jgi:hypothetical protein
VTEVFGLDRGLIEPIATSELSQLARRPLRAGLLTERFERDFPAVRRLHARDGLQEMRQQLLAAGWLAASAPSP